MNHAFSRTEMLIGSKGLERLKESKVAIFGIGGVGTFVVEGLARSGVGGLVLIDKDDICVTNINRQIHATVKTIGRPKVEVMRERILEINPMARVQIHRIEYNRENAGDLLSGDFSYVVDAIDMVSAKLDLIERCIARNIPIISSMGAGNKLNPKMLEVADIYDTSVCPLAKVVRRELRKRGIKGLKVVYSREQPITPVIPKDESESMQRTGEIENTYRECGPLGEDEGREIIRKQVPGSVSFVPSVAGLIIASEVVKDLIKDVR
jgi:tRNA A37 threonylcarbamoyladenosine dehydratase